MRKMKQRKKSKNRTGKICISCMVVVLTLIMSVQIGHLYQVNKQDEKTKQAQLKDEQERSAELQEKEAYVGSDQYIVDTAKSKLGMTYPDEIVFKEK